MLLMCKNTVVADVSQETVYAHNLLPGCLRNNFSRAAFIEWSQDRYAEQSNTKARQLAAFVFKQGNRDVMDLTTHALSLSDCYWVVAGDTIPLFEDIFPYYGVFWRGEGAYSNEAVPTLYVNGYLPKEWISSFILRKYGNRLQEEHSAIQDARMLSSTVVSSALGCSYLDVVNFTSTDCMFEAASCSGQIDKYAFTDADISNVFGEKGREMLVLDAILGNGDRHAGNFGFLRSPDTGDYLGMAPLFDFDHAYESNNVNDVLMQSILDNIAVYRTVLQAFRMVDTSKLSAYANERLNVLVSAL